MTLTQTTKGAIASIRSRRAGKSFVWYGDSCSGIPGGSNEENFAAINHVFQRLETMPDATFFIGDSIVGGDISADEFRAQWRHWLDSEMAWFHPLGIPLYNVTSNHNTTNETGETVYQEIHAHYAQNGPDNQKTLSHWVRDGDFLYIFVNTNSSELGGSGYVEHEWLDQVLTDQADARFKLVIGHHPIHAVNGYSAYPQWRVTPDDGKPFWDVLVRHGVLAYLCSHILIFDVQVHEGVLQITTGGAGTYGMPVVGLMPEAFEYQHLVQAAIDDAGIRYQVLDTNGVAREWLRWPEPELEADCFIVFDATTPPVKPNGDTWIVRFSISAIAEKSYTSQTIVTGWQGWEGPEAIWIGLAEASSRLTVRLVPEPGYGTQTWEGPVLDGAFDIELAIHSGMGPGGVLWRPSGGMWTSLISNTARGTHLLAWPEVWAVGNSQNGPSDRPFVGPGLHVDVATASINFLDQHGSAVEPDAN